MKIALLNASMTGKSLNFTKKFIFENYKDAFVIDINLNEKLSNEVLSSKTLSTFTSDADEYIKYFVEYDLVILTTGLYNSNIAPVAQSFMNKIVVPGKTLKYGPKGPMAVMKDEFKAKFIVVATSGSPIAMLKPSVKNVFETIIETAKIIGIENARLVFFDGIDRPELAGKTLEEKWEFFKNNI